MLRQCVSATAAKDVGINRRYVFVQTLMWFVYASAGKGQMGKDQLHSHSPNALGSLSLLGPPRRIMSDYVNPDDTRPDLQVTPWAQHEPCLLHLLLPPLPSQGRYRPSRTPIPPRNTLRRVLANNHHATSPRGHIPFQPKRPHRTMRLQWRR